MNEEMNEEDKERIEGIVFGKRVDSFNRFSIFLQHRKNFTNCEYWYGLGSAYQGSDNLFIFRDLVVAAFAADRDCRGCMMDESEKLFLEAFPEEMTIYRAMTVKESKSRRFGVSWTLSKDVAEGFRDKYERNYATQNEPKTLIEKNVSKKDVIAYFDGRKEQEIIYLGSETEKRARVMTDKQIDKKLAGVLLNKELADELHMQVSSLDSPVFAVYQTDEGERKSLIREMGILPDYTTVFLDRDETRVRFNALKAHNFIRLE